MQDYPTCVQTFSGHKQSEENVLRDIILNLDYELDKAYKVYKEILEIDLGELDTLADEVNTFGNLSKRKRKNIHRLIDDELVLSSQLLDNNENCFYGLIADRIVKINKRVQSLIRTQFEEKEIIELKK